MWRNYLVPFFFAFSLFFKQRTVQIIQLLVISSSTVCRALTDHNRSHPSDPTNHKASSPCQTDWFDVAGVMIFFHSGFPQNNLLFMSSSAWTQKLFFFCIVRAKFHNSTSPSTHVVLNCRSFEFAPFFVGACKQLIDLRAIGLRVAFVFVNHVSQIMRTISHFRTFSAVFRLPCLQHRNHYF